MSEGLVSATDATPRTPLRPLLLAALPLLGLLALVLLLFNETVAAMVGIWSRSDTFAHAFLVPPIALWLVWRQRHGLIALPRRAAPAWLVPMAVACVVWLLAQMAAVASAAQFAVVAMLILCVPLVLGTAAARRIAFPLLFLFFCVPFGEFLVEPMMEGTADFTIWALRESGIPVYREGLQFIIPSGHWSVVEACSGVRYLIASFMIGTLFAYLNFGSTAKRLVFVAFALAVPVVANWLRAYMIVMLGHYSGNTVAVGADHLLYGWVFFGVVILIMFTIGARFADAPTAPPQPTAGHGRAGASAASAASDRSAVWLVVLLTAALLAGTQGLRWQLERPAGAPAASLVLPAQLPGGWSASDTPLSTWEPLYQNASSVARRTYRRGDATVGVWVAYYRDQNQERKLITSTNVLVPQRSPEWLTLPAAPVAVSLAGGDDVSLRATQLRTPADPKANPRQRLLVLQAYRVDRAYASDDVRAKLRLTLARLLGRGDGGAVLIFYAEVDESARAETLRGFAADHLPAFAALVDAQAP
jgi:exosortase A